MPSLSLNGGIARISWQILSLSSPFNTTYYQEVGIATGLLTGESSSVSGRIDYVTAVGTTGGSYNVPTTPRSASYSSYGNVTLHAYARAANGFYYPAGSATTTVLMPWYWSSSWTVGSNLIVSAGSYQSTSGNGDNSWNGFLYRVNQVRRFKGLSDYSFTYAQSGQPMYATQFNQAVAAISAMNPSVSVGSNVTQNVTTIQKADFNRLSSALNSIT
jgi:hypothetical protein